MQKLIVRFANNNDLNWLAKNDDISKHIIKRKTGQKEIIVAQLQKKLIGHIRVEFLWSKVPCIGVIRVDKNHQKQGVGKSLIQFLESHLIKKGYKILCTSSVASEKEPRRWHKKMGFKECGYIDTYSKRGKGDILLQESVGKQGRPTHFSLNPIPFTLSPALYKPLFVSR